MCLGDQKRIVFLSNGALMQQKVHLNGHPKLVCKEAYFFPTDICRAIPCANPRDTKWIQASGKATLYTFAIVGYETGKAPHPGFEAPYVTAIVELEEGPTMPTNIVMDDPTPEKLQIGMPLEVVFEDITDEIALPKFKPV